SGSGDTPTGTVSFYDGSDFLGTGTLNGSGTATLTTSTLPAASHTITAVYGGDDAYAGSTSGAHTETINQAATATAVDVSMSPAGYGQPLRLDATVSTPIGFPTGDVSFYDGTTLLGTATLDHSRTAQFTTSALGLGSHTITAVYGGDSNFTGSSSDSLS